MNNPTGDIDSPMPFVTDEKFDLIISYMKSANVDPEILENILKERGEASVLPADSSFDVSRTRVELPRYLYASFDSPGWSPTFI